MDFTQPVLTIGHLVADADYSAVDTYLGRGFAQSSNTAVTVVTVAGQRALGLLQNGPVSGAPAELAVEGIALGQYGGTVLADDDLIFNASGQLVSAGLAGAGVARPQVIARAIVGGSSGDVQSVLLLGATQRQRGLPYTWSMPLAGIAASGNIVTSLPIGAMFGVGRIARFDAFVTVAGTGAGAALTFNLEIDTVDVTGGVITASLANTATVGALLAGTAITAANAFGVASVLDVETVFTTAFTAGQLTFQIVLA